MSKVRGKGLLCVMTNFLNTLPHSPICKLTAIIILLNAKDKEDYKHKRVVLNYKALRKLFAIRALSPYREK